MRAIKMGGRTHCKANGIRYDHCKRIVRSEGGLIEEIHARSYLGRSLVEPVQDTGAEETSDAPADLHVDRQYASKFERCNLGSVCRRNVDLKRIGS